MPSPIDLIAVKQGLDSKTSSQLIDILSFTQDDYNPVAIPLIEEILIERGLSINEITNCRNKYSVLKANLENQPKLYRAANFWPRFLNYIVDHFVCFGLCMVLQSIGEYTRTNEGNYYLFCMLIYIFYYAIFIGIFSATPGMLILGLTVVDSKTKKPINFFIGMSRGIFMVLNFLTLQIGHLVMLANKNKYTLVDKLSGTSVVYVR